MSKIDLRLGSSVNSAQMMCQTHDEEAVPSSSSTPALIETPLQGDSLEVVARGSVIAKGDSLRTIPIPDQDISFKVRMSEPLVLVSEDRSYA